MMQKVQIYVRWKRGRKFFSCFLFQQFSCELQKIKVSKEKIWYFLQLRFEKSGNANQAAEIRCGIYGPDTATANYA